MHPKRKGADRSLGISWMDEVQDMIRTSVVILSKLLANWVRMSNLPDNGLRR
jgi:hypothetical protein